MTKVNTVNAGRSRDRSGAVPVELTSFVGRRSEIRTAHNLVTTANLVTLVGTGGVGKTRLAMRVVDAVQKTEPTVEVRWVRLGALLSTATPDTIEREVSRAIGVKDVTDHVLWDVMVDHLRERLARVPSRRIGYLLVLDNCEHLVELAGELVHDLLNAVGGLHILATSREPLGCQGERLQLVPPLSNPHAGDTMAPAHPAEALELLMERASAVGFTISEDNRDAAERLCQQLDGIPLAIELAAAGLRGQSIDEIADGLNRGASSRFRLLSGGPRHGGNPIHQSLRAALDWSYQLCSSPEQDMWARVSVFDDGWDLEAAQAVCTGGRVAPEDVLALLGNLVDKSVVIADTSGNRARYRLLPTLRHYAQIHDQPEREQVELRRRHRDYYLGVAARAAQDWYSPRELEWMEWTRTELPNLRAALNWSIGTPGEGHFGLELAIRLAQLHAQFFVLNLGETLQWLESGLPHVKDSSDSGMEFRLAASALAGWTALCLGDASKAKDLLEEARDRARDPRHPQLLFFEGVFSFLAEGDPRGVAGLSDALAAFDNAGMRFSGDRFVVLLLKSMAASFFSGTEVALATTQQCHSEAGASGSLWALSKSMWVRGLALTWHGNPQQAVNMEREAMRRQREMDDRWGLIWSTHALAWAFAEVVRQTPERLADLGPDLNPAYVARLLGGAHALRDRTRVAIAGLPAFATANERAIRTIQASLDPESYTSAYADGSRLLDDEILSLALDGVTTAPATSEEKDSNRTRTLWDELTGTEREIAALVAQGLTNAQIARQRISSVRTVEKHVENLRHKLLAESRAEIARWVPAGGSTT